MELLDLHGTRRTSSASSEARHALFDGAADENRQGFVAGDRLGFGDELVGKGELEALTARAVAFAARRHGHHPFSRRERSKATLCFA